MRLLLAVVLLGAGVEAMPLQPCRLFAVGYRVRVEAAASYSTFAADLERVMGQVSANRLGDAVNLVLFPEDIGLLTALLGSRGAKARDSRTLGQALAALAEAWYPQLQHYLPRVMAASGLSAEQAAPRALLLAVADPMVRAFQQAFGEAARRHGCYLLACLNAPETRLSTDPDEVRLFRGEVPGPTGEALVAVGTEVYNSAWLFSPQGEVVGKVKKVNLVPLERDILHLTPGPPAQQTVFDLPCGKIGVAICFDAFQPDYIAGLAQAGAAIVLQPSANPAAWAAGEPWQAEEWLKSVLMTIQQPGIEYHACAMMTGRLFDLTFDGQSIITARGSEAPPRLFVGVEPTGHRGRVLALAPWLAEDDVGLPLEPRRARLRAIAGRVLANDPGAPNFAESLIWADLP